MSNQAFIVEKQSRIKCIASSKTYNVKSKNVSKPPMLKMLKKVDEGNEETNQISMRDNAPERTQQKTQRHEREKQIVKAVETLG